VALSLLLDIQRLERVVVLIHKLGQRWLLVHFVEVEVGLAQLVVQSEVGGLMVVKVVGVVAEVHRLLVLPLN
jgi:hypothetical protein